MYVYGDRIVVEITYLTQNPRYVHESSTVVTVTVLNSDGGTDGYGPCGSGGRVLGPGWPLGVVGSWQGVGAWGPVAPPISPAEFAWPVAALLACTAKVNASVAAACRRRASATSGQLQWAATSGTHMGSGSSTTSLPYHPRPGVAGGSRKSSVVGCRSRAPPAPSLCCEVEACGGRVPSTCCFFFGGSSVAASSTRRRGRGCKPWATTIGDVDVVAPGTRVSGVAALLGLHRRHGGLLCRIARLQPQRHQILRGGQGLLLWSGSHGCRGGLFCRITRLRPWRHQILRGGLHHWDISGGIRCRCGPLDFSAQFWHGRCIPASAHWLWRRHSPPGRALRLRLGGFLPNRPSVLAVGGGGHDHIFALLGCHGRCRHLLPAVVVGLENFPELLGDIPRPQLEGALRTEEVLILRRVPMLVVVSEVVPAVETLRADATPEGHLLLWQVGFHQRGRTSVLSVPSDGSECTCTPIHVGRRRKASVIIEGHPVHLVTRINLGTGCRGNWPPGCLGKWVWVLVMGRQHQRFRLHQASVIREGRVMG